MAIEAVLTFGGDGTLIDSMQTAEKLGCRVTEARMSGGKRIVRVEIETTQTGNELAMAALENTLSFRLC